MQRSYLSSLEASCASGALYCSSTPCKGTMIDIFFHNPRSCTASPPKPKLLHPSMSFLPVVLLMQACSELRVLGRKEETPLADPFNEYLRHHKKGTLFPMPRDSCISCGDTNDAIPQQYCTLVVDINRSNPQPRFTLP